jgi:hypothetical protein
MMMTMTTTQFFSVLFITLQVQPNSSDLVYNTLLELYLHDMMHEQAIAARVDRERKTLELLKNPDVSYTLVFLCFFFLKS